MEEKLPVLWVNLFGKEKITYGNRTILYGKNSITKGMKLLFLLLYYGKQGVSRSKLLEDLYGKEDLADAANNLRVTIHRLKKMLVDAGLPDHEYIFYKGGCYFWDSPMETIVDTDLFSERFEAARKEDDTDKKLELLTEACELYRGEFLERIIDMEWILTERVRFKSMYTYALQEACNMLLEKRDFEQALKLAEPACKIYPFDEWQVIKIDCYIGMNRNQ